MNVYAKFRHFPLRINKALGIFRIGVTTTTTRRRTRTTLVAIRDAFQRLKIKRISIDCVISSAVYCDLRRLLQLFELTLNVIQ